MAGQGLNVRGAVGKEATWGSGVAVDEIIPVLNEDVNKLYQRLDAEYLDGRGGKLESQGDISNATGSIALQGMYDVLDSGTVKGIDSFLFLALGSATYNSGTNTANQYTPADVISDSYTIGFYKSVSAWETQGAKINNLTIEGTIGEGVTVTADIAARNVLRTGDVGIINAAADITGLSADVIPIMLDLQHAVFRVGAHGTALAAANRFKISQFSLGINNNLAVDQHATPDNSNHPDATYPLEPLRNALRDITFSVTIPRYESNAFFGWLDNDTAVQADLKFTSPTGGYKFNIYLPNLRVVTPAAPVPDASIFPLTVEFIGLINGSINDSMNFEDATAITKEIGIETRNQRTAIP